MPVLFKFRSSVGFDAVDLGGRPSISVRDLRARVAEQKNLQICADSRLVVFDAGTGEAHEDQEFMIPDGSSVIIKPVPAAPCEFGNGGAVGIGHTAAQEDFLDALVSSRSEVNKGILTTLPEEASRPSRFSGRGRDRYSREISKPSAIFLRKGVFSYGEVARESKDCQKKPREDVMRDRVGDRGRKGRIEGGGDAVGKTVAVKPSRLGFAPNPSWVPSVAEEEEEQRLQNFSNAK
ncbi:hypothetical protein Taro_006000 [Colocasia esculenta]|uniref:DWNN domain-containing protein n=1 Tax=Colocasia esculenta TaxID=4460 RepID=A0A843TW77_COLES|nr:hypothetical protein [Colocasia esculenta]